MRRKKSTTRRQHIIAASSSSRENHLSLGADCNIPHLEIKNNTLMSIENIVIFFFIYIYIHGFHIKIYRNFDGVPSIPEGPNLLICNLFTLLITRIS